MRSLIICAFACILVVQGSPVGGQATAVSSPSPGPQPNGTGMQPPVSIPPPEPAPGPQTTKPLPPSVWPSPSTSPPNPLVLPPVRSNNSVPPSAVEAPAPIASPSNSSPPIKQIHPLVPKSAPPNPLQTKAPPSNAPRIKSPPVTGTNTPPRPPRPVFLGEPPSFPPDVLTHPTLPGTSVPVKPIPSTSPSSPPVRMLAPPPSISRKTVAMPAAAPTKGTAHHKASVRHFPAKAPSASKLMGHSSNAPPPQLFSKSRPMFHYPPKHHHAKMYRNTPAPLSHGIYPTPGSLPSPSFPSSDDPYASMSPSVSPLRQPKIPYVAVPKFSPPGFSPETRQPPLMRALPPPPPHTADCASLTCQEPLAYGPPESPCACVLPIQVGIRLDVSLYTFFPLVSELASEIAAGVFLKQSQVRIMGANAAEDDPEKTISHIDLLPIERKFDDTTAYLTFQRFWNKKVAIKTSFFGAYDVLYVRYPGLPPSPPLPASAIGTVIPGKPYPGRDNKTSTIQPLGVDISREENKRGPSGSMLAAIIVSCLVTVILLCAVIWVLIFRHRLCIFQPDPTPPSTIRSLAKSSGIPMSLVRSGPTSPTFSLGSSIAACTASARTFSSNDIERATDFFNETKVIGEGGFGRVYSGVLEGDTKVAIKILKRYDQQGGREFLAEVEMLSRLHHRNLVKLIGICVEDRTRCLVYELIPNGSVESHLHGVDKERSPLNWSTRLKIALGAARALAYLHEDSCPCVIHRDFKASNILLEDDFTPKVSDFGLARAALDEENRHISTRVMGTFGYLAPEYAMTGHLLVKSDVYSYGVVLLELLTGRKPIDMSQPPGQENLVSWVRPLLTNQESLESIIDPSLGPDSRPPFNSIAKVAAIASMCVQPEVSQRPFMGEVVQALRLVSDESRGSSHEDLSMMVSGQSSGHSERLVEALMTPSSDGDCDYGYSLDDDVGSEVSLTELLSSAAAPQLGPGPGSGSLRRYGSSSGPIGRTSKTRGMWKTVRRLSRGSVSEHGVLLRLWPGSH